MLLKQNLSLKGNFSYRIFNKDGILKREIENIENFITPTGLYYPTIFKFADCFRFLSLGSGTSPNTILGIGTTGLNIPLSSFSYIGSRTGFSDITTSDYETPGCGYTEDLGIVTLSRSWKVPSSDSTFNGDYNFNELMLSPGRPTGSDMLCGCGGGAYNGVDASIVADYYDGISNGLICNANKSFTRIVLDDPIIVNDKDFLIVSYDLTINYDTGVNSFINHISNNFSTNWSGNITGISNIIHHGVALINDGNITDKSLFRNQANPNSQSYAWTLEYGESFIPLWGAPLEPSCIQDNLIAYLSTDNVQFLVNQKSGGHLDIDNWQPYNPNGNVPSSGLFSFISQPSEITDGRYFNIRTNLPGPIYPSQSNVLVDGDPYSDNNYIFHSSIGRQKILPFNSVTRTRTGLYSAVFTNLNSINWHPNTNPSPVVRSMVFNYSDSIAVSQNIMYPFFDLLFTGNLGDGLPVTGSDGSYSSPTNNYFYLGGGGDLTLSLALIWGSDCSPDVIGC